MKPKQQGRTKMGGEAKKNLTLSIMASPAVILLFVFSFIPMIGLVLAFKDFRFDRGFFDSDWVGLRNFAFFFKSNDAWRVLGNTILLNFAFIICTLITSVAIALVLNEVKSRRVIKTTQTILFFPYFMSWVVVGYLLYAFLQHDYGILNGILQAVGMKPVAWYSKAEYWPIILTVMAVWKGAGYNSVIYYASMIGIDSSYYEAAEIDGATRWQMMWRITLPLLKNIITIMLILQVGRIMYADFGQFFQLTRDQGALYPTTDVLDTYIFRALRVTGDIGIGAAVGFFQAIVGLLLILGTNALARKLDRDSALF